MKKSIVISIYEDDIDIIRKKEGAKKHSNRRHKKDSFKKNVTKGCKTHYNGYYDKSKWNNDKKGIRMFHGKTKNCRKNMHYYKKATRKYINIAYKNNEDFAIPKNQNIYKKFYSQGFTN